MNTGTLNNTDRRSQAILALIACLAVLVVAMFVYLVKHLLEALLIVDYRFVFPFASDLTPYRFLMFLVYLPFLLIGFLLMALFLHGQFRRQPNW